MACRSCSKSSLGLLTRGASLFETTTSRRISPSSLRKSTPHHQLQTRTISATPQRCRENKDIQPEQKPQGTASNLAKILKATVAPTNTYAVYGLTEQWALLCSNQAEYTISKEDRKMERIPMTEEGEEVGVSSGGVWHNEFHLLPTFSTWSQVSMLHMYLLAVRFRSLPKESHEKWQKQLVDHFFHQAEAKMDIVHDMGSASIRQRYLKDLFVQWRGVILAYDEGLVKGDAVLASAVWRNLYKAREDVDTRVLSAVVAWMRRTLRVLDRTEDEELPMMIDGLFEKYGPAAELEVVDGWAGVMSGVAGEGATVEKKATGTRFA